MYEVKDNVVQSAINFALMLGDDVLKLDSFEGFDGEPKEFVKSYVKYITTLGLGMKMCADINDLASSQEEFDENLLEALVMAAPKLIEYIEDGLDSLVEDFEAVSVSGEEVMEELGVDPESLEDDLVDGSMLDDEIVQLISEKTGMPEKLIRAGRFVAYDKSRKCTVSPEDVVRAVKGESRSDDSKKVGLDEILKKADDAHKNI